MKRLRHTAPVLALGVMMAGFFAGRVVAQEPESNNLQKETSMTGCLNKGGGSGEYTLTDDKTGQKTTVMGTSELEKHASNHKVTLTGRTTTDAKGNQVFEVTKIKHVSASCTAESQ
jgi:hypothetical protein